VDNIREVLGDETIAKIFYNRHINKKLLVDVPDGVYDHVSKQGLGWRMVYIDKYLVYIIASSWIKKGGPSYLPSVISTPAFGTFPDIS
jgi:hypothetical protein